MTVTAAPALPIQPALAFTERRYIFTALAPLKLPLAQNEAPIRSPGATEAAAVWKPGQSSLFVSPPGEVYCTRCALLPLLPGRGSLGWL